MSEREQGLSFPGVPSSKKERLTRPLLEARGKILAGERPGGGEAVQGGAGMCRPAVGIEEASYGATSAGGGHGDVQGFAELEHALFDERRLDGTLRLEVLVEGGGLDAHFGRQPAHGECVRALFFQDAPRRCHNLPSSLRASRELRRYRHCSAIANTGCFGAIAATSSSVDLGPTPSKKTPTSAFQRPR